MEWGVNDQCLSLFLPLLSVLSLCFSLSILLYVFLFLFLATLLFELQIPEELYQSHGRWFWTQPPATVEVVV